MASGFPGHGGWIAPDGRFWSSGNADHQRHQAVAQRIVSELGIGTAGRDPAHQLERLGWIHLHDFGLILNEHGYEWGFTQGQINTLFDLALTHDEMRNLILSALSTHIHSEVNERRQFGWSDLLPATQGI